MKDSKQRSKRPGPRKNCPRKPNPNLAPIVLGSGDDTPIVSLRQETLTGRTGRRGASGETLTKQAYRCVGVVWRRFAPANSKGKAGLLCGEMAFWQRSISTVVASSQRCYLYVLQLSCPRIPAVALCFENCDLGL